MIAVLSDVHGNLEALQAVVADMKARQVKRVIFLGDMVGYGPDPLACLEIISRFEFCLLGNHDRAVVHGIPNSFNTIARQAALWTRRQLDPAALRLKWLRPLAVKRRRTIWTFLQKLKPSGTFGQFFCAHDNPVSPGDDRYVLGQEMARAALAQQPSYRAFLIGHSHQPLFFTTDERVQPEPGRPYPFDRRCIINVGSVGQPRDGDARAGYVLLERDSFRFMRLPYDFQRTQAKILKAGLHPTLAQRLSQGR
jgi:predicted phosphodiesterase